MDKELSRVLQESAQRILAAAIEAEVSHFQTVAVAPAASELRDATVRNGYHPPRLVATGVGAVAVRLPKLRRRSNGALPFRSQLVPRYIRRVGVLHSEALSRYVCAIARGDLREALVALVGPQALGLPSPVVRRLQDWFLAQCAQWRAEIGPHARDALLLTPNLTAQGLEPIVSRGTISA
jgi:hypothetical protein